MHRDTREACAEVKGLVVRKIMNGPHHVIAVVHAVHVRKMVHGRASAIEIKCKRESQPGQMVQLIGW